MKGGKEPLLRLFWLGHPRVELEGREIHLETRKTTALLSYLSLSEYPQSREKLAALFWPDFDSSRAPANLRRSIASLHASLSAAWVVADRDQVQLRRDEHLWNDLLAARVSIAGIKAHCGGSAEPCPHCLDMAEKAVSLFRGDFLEGFNLPDCLEFDDWQTAQRESSRGDLAWLLEKSASGHASAGRWEEALCLAKRWLAQDPLHEPAQLLVIRILALSGQRIAAIRQYEGFAEALRSEFGQEPEDATRDLYNRILSREVGPRAAPLLAQGGASDRSRQRRDYSDGASRPLGTKLSAPPLRDALIRRARLTVRLEQGLAGGLVLVSAPAGFGKTTVLTELAVAARTPVAWLSLDDGDNNPRRFLLHLAASISRAADGLGDEVGHMLDAVPPAPFEMAMTALINAVQEGGSRLTLILDDYQFIHSSEVHTLMRFLIEHRPVPLAILIATREDPPFPLARLRSQQRLAEIRAEDLRFTTDEAAQFFDRVMAVPLSAEQLEALHRRTEGWIAGLQMAGLSLKGRSDVESFVASFSGTHRFVLDYLAEEVFAQQDADLTRFLLETSILPKLNAGLCQAVTDRCGCEELLRQLERMNLFLVPLDEDRTWYRYHHLFADLLRHRLKAERSAEEIRGLYVRAGDWFADQGDFVEAVHEYLTGAAHEKAADLIESKAYEMLSRGALSPLQAWCAEIPAPLRQERPGFRLASAWVLAWAGRKSEAEVLLDELERSVPTEGDEQSRRDRTLRGTVATIRAVLADMADETKRAVELAETGRRLLAPEDLMQHTVVLYILAKSHLYKGELAKAEEGCEEFLKACNAAGSIWSISAAVVELAHLRGVQGRLREEQRLLEEFDLLAARRRARRSGPVAKVYALLADVKREKGELDEALEMAEQATRDVGAWGLPSDVYLIHQFFARVLRSCGQVGRALEVLESARNLPRTAQVFAKLLPSFEAERAKTFLAAGDVASAERWIVEYGPGKSTLPLEREVELCTLARIRLAAGVTSGGLIEIIDILDDLIRSARAGARFAPLMAFLILRAKANALLSAEDAAMQSLDEAVRLAQPEGYLRIFVEEGPQIFELLSAGVERGIWRAAPLDCYVRGLLRAFANVV